MNLKRMFSVDLLHQVDDPVLIFREDQIVFANTAAVELFRYENDMEMYGLSVSHITSGYEKKKHYTLIEKEFLGASQTVETRRFQWIHQRADGDSFYSEVVIIRLAELGAQYKCVIINDLSDWNKKREQIQECQDSIESIFNNMDQIMLIIDPETGQVKDANHAAATFYGYTLDELKQLKISDINLLSVEEVQLEMVKAQEEKRKRFNFKHQLKDGTVCDVKVISGPVRFPDHTYLYSIVDPVRETGESSQIDQAFSQGGDPSYHDIFDKMPLPGVLVTRDMRVIVCNQAFTNVFGYSVYEASNRHIATLITPWEHIEETEFYQRLVLQGHVISQEGKRHDKAGRVRSYIIHGYPLYSNNEIDSVAIFYVDIDEHKRAHIKLHMIEKIFSNIDEGMLVTSPDQEIEWVNKAFCQISGFTMDELIGQKPKLWQSGKQDDLFYRNMWHDIEKKGSWEGEVWNKKKNGEMYAVWLTIVRVDDEMGQVSNYVAVSNDITKFIAQEEKIRQLAETDTLTGLMNRPTFLERAICTVNGHDRKEAHMILYVDLDQFKKINDTYGHDQGDLLLKVIAYRLKSALKADDLIARIGGDEFVILLKGVTYDNVDKVVERVFKIVSQPVQLDRTEVTMHTSIGVAAYPEDSGDVKELLKFADIALYKSKEYKGNHCEYYSREYEAVFQQTARLESDVQLAVARGELFMEYQGIVDAKSERLVMAEALCRWESPVHGRVSPAVFIPLAERNGCISSIGYWVLERVVADLSGWQEKGKSIQRVSINLSALQLAEQDFLEKLKALIHKYRVNPHQIELEITESVFIDDMSPIVSRLDELKTLGISIAMDDFGTGYSSLSMIHRLNLSKIKIDKSFVDGLLENQRVQELTAAIVAMAKSLGYGIVAEGVEQVDQHQWLSGAGCDYIQGYLFHKPVQAEAFVERLQEEESYLSNISSHTTNSR